MKNRSGFTLVEIMVVVASTGIIMTSIIGVVLGTFRAQNKEKSMVKVSETGSSIVSELRKNLLNSDSDSVKCATDNLSVSFTNLADQNTTTLACNTTTNKIASTSATRESVLNTNAVNVTNCSSFVSCQTDTFSNVISVTFNFGIGATSGGVSTSDSFKTTVTLRN